MYFLTSLSNFGLLTCNFAILVKSSKSLDSLPKIILLTPRLLSIFKEAYANLSALWLL